MKRVYASLAGFFIDALKQHFSEVQVRCHALTQERQTASNVQVECLSMTKSAHKPLEGIWIIDAEGRTVLASARMGEILGAVPAEMIGKSSFSYIFSEDLAAAQRLFNAKSSGDSKPFHFRLRRKDGSEVWVDVQGTPMRNASGEFNGIVGTFTVSDNDAAWGLAG